MSARPRNARSRTSTRTGYTRQGVRVLGLTTAVVTVAAACGGDGGGDTGEADADYPTRQIEIIVPFGAGGGVDINARATAPYLEEHLGSNVVVENREGAGGLTGHTLGSTSEPDGYTLTFVSPGIIGGPLTTEDAEFQPTDFEFIGQVTEVPNYVAVRDDSEWQTVGDLIEYGENNPGELVTGRSGFTSKGIAGELFRHEAGIEVEMTTGWEGGAEIMPALIAGELDYIITDDNELSSRDDLRPLCASAAERSDIRSEVPTCAEEGLDRVTQGVWRGLVAPAGTPEKIQQILSDALAAALDMPEMQEEFETAGLTVDYLDGAEFRQRVEDETETLSEVFADLGVLVEQ